MASTSYYDDVGDVYISIYEHMFEPLTRMKHSLNSVKYVHSVSNIQEVVGLKLSIKEMDKCIKLFIEDTSKDDSWLIKVLKNVKNSNSVALMLFRLVDKRPSEKMLSFIYSKLDDMSARIRIGIKGEKEEICKLIINSPNCPDWIKAEIFVGDNEN